MSHVIGKGRLARETYPVAAAAGSSASISALMLATDTNVRYVDPGGSDAAGTTGSRISPFRTVQAAIDNCKALASLANPFAIRVSPGSGYGTFKLAANVYVIGSGPGSGPPFNVGAQKGVTFLEPDPTQSLDATLAGASAKSTGILSAVLTTKIAADFAAIGNTGPADIIIDDVMTQFDIAITGTLRENATLTDVLQDDAGFVARTTITNLASSCIDIVNKVAGIFYVQNTSGGGFTEHVLGGHVSFVSCAWSGTDPLNDTLIVIVQTMAFNGGVSLTGQGAVMQYPFGFLTVLPDANERVGFGVTNTSTVQAPQGGLVILVMSPSTTRALIFEEPNATTQPTSLLIRNASATNPIDIAFASGVNAPGNPSYVPPAGEALITYYPQQALWMVDPYAQYFNVVLTNGVSPSTKADVTARTAAGLSVLAVNGSTALGALTVALTPGSRVGTGAFVVTSKIAATLATQTGDQSTIGVVLAG